VVTHFVSVHSTRIHINIHPLIVEWGQIFIVVDMNEIMLWRRSFFETNKTAQNGKYKCSCVTKCGLTGAILYCIKTLDRVHFTNKETSLCFGPVYQIKHPTEEQHLIVLHIGSCGGFFGGFAFCHPLRNAADNTDDGVTFLVLAGYEPVFHTLL